MRTVDVSPDPATLPHAGSTLEQSIDSLAVTANGIADQLVEARRLLRHLHAWIHLFALTSTENRSTGKGGHDGNGNSWTVCVIPEWDCRQKLAAIEQVLRGAQ